MSNDTPALDLDVSYDLARSAASAAADKRGYDIVALDVSQQLALTDVFVLVSATNDRQIGAIVDAVEESLRKRGHKPQRREGDRNARWILLDFGSIIVHVMHEEERRFYSLERLWKDCDALEVESGERSEDDDHAARYPWE